MPEWSNGLRLGRSSLVLTEVRILFPALFKLFEEDSFESLQFEELELPMTSVSEHSSPHYSNYLKRLSNKKDLNTKKSSYIYEKDYKITFCNNPRGNFYYCSSGILSTNIRNKQSRFNNPKSNLITLNQIPSSTYHCSQNIFSEVIQLASY